MNFDRRIALLFIPHAIAIAACAAIFAFLPDRTMHQEGPPEFLAAVDKLHQFTLDPATTDSPVPVKDAFRHEWTVDPSGYAPAADTGASTSPSGITVSMIVDAGSESYCIINGIKMHTGDKGTSFTVGPIEKDRVTIIHSNGTREIYHVKAY